MSLKFIYFHRNHFNVFFILIIIISVFEDSKAHSNPIKSTGSCSKECKRNEFLSSCINSVCEYRKCSDIGNGIKCIRLDPRFCEQGCQCIDGYLRADNGTCIPQSQCPTPKPPMICGINEEYSNCANGGCRRWKCSHPGIMCADLAQGACQGGCICKSSYTRSGNGTCIPVNQCPPPKAPVICRSDEEYSSCVNGGCGRWKCSQPGLICIDLVEGACQEGCRCKVPLLRADDGSCVPADQCPPVCTGPNEAYGCKDSYSESCGSLLATCETSLQPLSCSPGCYCKDGFYRSKNGICISKENCLKCTGSNEYFSCGGACDNVCAHLSKQNQTNCPIVNIVCNPMCYCDENYARDINNICVPFNECPRIECGVNEEFDVCPQLCPPQRCDVDETLILCQVGPTPGHPACKPGCRCRDGYYRNIQGTCVRKNQCQLSPVITPQPVADQKELETLLQNSVNQFTAKMFYEVAKANPGKSIILSAYSVLTPLAQLALASVGQTNRELLNTIGMPDDQTTKAVFSLANSIVNSAKGITIKTATKIYLAQNYQLNSTFAMTTRDIFGTEVQNVNFSKNQETANIVNTWVEEKTNNRIKNLVDPKSLDGNTRALLVNAIYFKGFWKNQFNKDLTTDRDFHVTKDTVIKIPTMYRKGDYKYSDNDELKCQVLQIPYQGDESYILIVLPRNIDGIIELENKLRDPSLIDKAVNKLYNTKLEVYLPKFKIETITNLKDVFQKINVTRIFKYLEAELYNLVTNAKDLYISNAIQKAFIEVNEEGAEAAAVNSFEGVALSAMLSPPPIPIFRSDRPFYYVLRLNSTSLFDGVMYGK